MDKREVWLRAMESYIRANSVVSGSLHSFNPKSVADCASEAADRVLELYLKRFKAPLKTEE